MQPVTRVPELLSLLPTSNERMKSSTIHRLCKPKIQFAYRNSAHRSFSVIWQKLEILMKICQWEVDKCVLFLIPDISLPMGGRESWHLGRLVEAAPACRRLGSGSLEETDLCLC